MRMHAPDGGTYNAGRWIHMIPGNSWTKDDLWGDGITGGFDDGLADADTWVRLQVLALRADGLSTREISELFSLDHSYVAALWARSEELGEWNRAQKIRFVQQLNNSHRIAKIKKDAATWPRPTSRRQRRQRIVALYERGLTCRAIADLTGDGIVNIARHTSSAVRRGEMEG
ncbi:hypothetical protein Ae717Ps2_5917 [Pseudonocardia sp. Ae717_Ps2]|nr:hypothetical protein Ae717Ps2_5917 [Pseudonocardia sp. Ae717_Ps2]